MGLWACNHEKYFAQIEPFMLKIRRLVGSLLNRGVVRDILPCYFAQNLCLKRPVRRLSCFCFASGLGSLIE